MKKLFLVLMAFFAVTLSAVAYADDAKIGIVDVRQILQKSPQVAAIQKKLQEEFGTRDQQMQAAQQQLQQDAEKLNRDSAVMSANDRAALTKKMQTEQQTLRAMQISFQKDVYAKQNQEMQVVLARLQNVVAKVAKEKNLTLVVTKDAVEYSNNDLDITNEVAKEMLK